jgi:chromosome segregation ATPase
MDIDDLKSQLAEEKAAREKLEVEVAEIDHNLALEQTKVEELGKDLAEVKKLCLELSQLLTTLTEQAETQLGDKE